MDPQSQHPSKPSQPRLPSTSFAGQFAGLGRIVAYAVCLTAWFTAASCIVTADDSRAQVQPQPRVSASGVTYDGGQIQYPGQDGKTFVPELPISNPPFHEFHASWVQRLDEPYVYMDHYGPYSETGSILPVVLREMRIQGLEAAGPPFALFFDDPSSKPADQLLSRACVPIASERSPITPLRYDVLPSQTVAYAYVSGSYPEVPRCYPHLLEYMRKMNWELAGPIREVYIVPPSFAKGPAELLTKVQVPVRRSN